MPSLSYFLKLLVMVFPIALGIGLTSLGVSMLAQASEKPTSRPLSPYGILAFCSEKCDFFTLSMTFFSIDLKSNSVGTFCVLNFHLASVEIKSSFEVIIGLQIPYQVEILQDRQGGVQVYTGIYELEVLQTETMFSQIDRTSIFYLRFMTEPENSDYNVYLWFNWKDFVNRQSYALYEIMVPLSSSSNNIAIQYFPSIYPLNTTAINLSIDLPGDCEIRDTIPRPDKEELISFNLSTPGVLEPHRYLMWELPARVLKVNPNPVSDIIRVRFELLGESEQRNRLLFDSGLYLGLGIGLIISGIHEAIKFTSEAKKSSDS